MGSVFMSLEFLLPVVIAAALVLLVVLLRSNKAKKTDYDERQLSARNAAYKGSFIFLFSYCLFCGLLQGFNVRWAVPLVQTFLGVILSLTLFVALCIIKDAYFSNSPKQIFGSVISFFVFCVYGIYFLIKELGEGGAVWSNGELSEPALYLTASVCFFILGMISIFKIISERRKSED